MHTLDNRFVDKELEMHGSTVVDTTSRLDKNNRKRTMDVHFESQAREIVPVQQVKSNVPINPLAIWLEGVKVSKT